MTRAKLTGLRRNLAVAIGNSRDTDAIGALTAGDDERPSIRDGVVEEHIKWVVATQSTI